MMTMTKLMMEMFHLVKKAGITRDLIVGQTHEAKRANSERFVYYDTNHQCSYVLSRNLGAANKYVDSNLPVLDRDKDHVTFEKFARS